MNKSFLWSLLGHIFIITLMVLDLSFGFQKKEQTPPVIMMIDLTKVKISDKTNLPQKAIVQKKKTTPKSVSKKQTEKVVPHKAPQKPVQKTAPKPIVKPKETSLKEAARVKTSTPVKQEKKPESVQKQKANTDLQNLLASVEKVRKAPVVKEVSEIQAENEGIETGTEGRIDQILTISERDFLASELQKCWNVNAGVERADEIVVEIKAWMNKDGSVRDVKIMNNMPISSFKTVAESAKRAVYVCHNKGVDSPFRILAEKYSDHYGDWKEISFRFNPLLGIQ
ncbi:MAG: hypothetical protein ACI4OR_01040 [Alphaproteobacteria bacterium]